MGAEINQSDSEYRVGYGKPPEHFRFKKGQSGNPKGRPRSSKNFMTLLLKGLEQKVTVQENGRQRKITKREAMITQAINKATSGHEKALQFLWQKVVEADALAQARREESNSSEDDNKMKFDLMIEALKILRGLGVDMSLPERAVAQIEARSTPEETVAAWGPEEHKTNKD